MIPKSLKQNPNKMINRALEIASLLSPTEKEKGLAVEIIKYITTVSHRHQPLGKYSPEKLDDIAAEIQRELNLIIPEGNE